VCLNTTTSARHRIIPASAVVQQPALAIQPLPGVVVRDGHRAPGVVHRTIRLVEFYCGGCARAGDGHHHVAQQIAYQVGERAVDLFGQALAVDAVVLGGRGRPA